MKNFTDLEQSKKLVEFLSFESADYHYIVQGKKSYFYPYSLSRDAIKHYDENIKYIPCWSLTALLGVLPAYRFEIFYYKGAHEYNVYAEFDKCHSNIGVGENIVDACYELILKLHKLNLL